MSSGAIQRQHGSHSPLESQGRCHEQGPNPVHHRSHSLPEEPRTGIMSKVHIQLTTEATHQLKARTVVSRVQIQLTTEATHWLDKPRTGLVIRI